MLAPTQLRPTRAALVGSRIASAPVALVLLVVAGTLARMATSFERATPLFLPDEFLYPQLARSLASGAGVAVLGEPSAFPALLEPLLTSVFWRTGDAELAIRLTQAVHCLAVGLAAVPVYVLARRLRLSTRAALAAAAAAVLGPGLLFASFLTADAIGYLLALVALDAGVRALSSPTRTAQAFFLAAALLATFGRIQYALLLPAFAVAALVIERGRIRQAVRRFDVVVLALGAATVAAVAMGPSALGRYEIVSTFGASTSVATWLLATTMLLTIAVGVAIVPGAAAWVVTQLRHGRERERTALAALAVALLVPLAVVTSVMTVETFSDRFIERYLIVAVPIAALAFACWIDEGRPGRFIAIGVAVALILAVARIPLSGYTVGQGSADSPTLFALGQLERMIGKADASLAAALIVTAGCLLAGAAALTRRVRAAALAGFTLALLTTASVGSYAFDLSAARRVHGGLFARDASWVDAERPGDVLLVQTPWSNRFDAMLTALWNTSITRAAPLGDDHIDPIDGLGEPVRVRADGLLSAGAGPVRSPVLFALGGTAAAFADAKRVVYDRRFALVVPRGAVRLAMLAHGIRFDGKVSPSGSLTVWPTPDGRCTSLTVRLTVPKGLPATTLALEAGDGSTRRVRVASGAPTALTLTSSQAVKRTIRYRTIALGGTPPGPFVGTVAEARYTSKPVPCGA